MRTRLIDIKATGTGYTDIFATIPCRRVEIVEDDSVTAQGLNFKVKDDGTAGGFTTVFNAQASREPVILGNQVAHQNNAGPIIGFPAQNAPTGAWAIGTAYAVGDQVTDDGFAYVCILAAGSVGHKPVLFPTDWAVIRNYIAATKLFSAESKNLATKVRVTEFE